MKISQREYPTIDGSPGDILLRLFMQPLGLTAYRISADLGVPPIAISQILHGRRAISAAMAIRLGGYFGVEPHFWLTLQSAHELQAAKNAPAGSAALEIPRCPALADRQFVIRESRSGANRHFEVILVRPKSNRGTRSDVSEQPGIRPIGPKGPAGGPLLPIKGEQQNRPTNRSR